MSDFLNLIGCTDRAAIWLQKCVVFQEEINYLIDNLQIIKGTALLLIVQVASAQNLGCRNPWQSHALGSHKTLEVMLPPWWSWRVESQMKEDYCHFLSCNGICLDRFWTHLGPIAAFFFPISLCLNDLSYICLIIVFWKHRICLVSQVLERNFASE